MGLGSSSGLVASSGNTTSYGTSSRTSSHQTTGATRHSHTERSDSDDDGASCFFRCCEQRGNSALARSETTRESATSRTESDDVESGSSAAARGRGFRRGKPIDIAIARAWTWWGAELCDGTDNPWALGFMLVIGLGLAPWTLMGGPTFGLEPAQPAGLRMFQFALSAIGTTAVAGGVALSIAASPWWAMLLIPGLMTNGATHFFRHCTYP